MLVVTTVFAGSALVAALARTVILWFNMNISARVGTDISCNVFQKILLQDYEYHLQTNSSSIVSSINIDLLKTVSAVRSFLQMCTTIIVSFGLVTGLFIVDFYIALTLMISFDLYGIFAIIVKSLRINSTFISKVSFLHIKTLQEGLGSIVEIILNTFTISTYLNIVNMIVSKDCYFPKISSLVISRFIIEGISLSYLCLLATSLSLLEEIRALEVLSFCSRISQTITLRTADL